MIRRLVSRLALWSLSASFPSVRRAPCGRFARARLVWSCRFVPFVSYFPSYHGATRASSPAPVRLRRLPCASLHTRDA